MTRWIVGIDEAGRGPLAGPVAVGVSLISLDFDWRQVPGVNDSKKLSEARREEVFALTRALQRDGVLDYQVALVGAATIDQIGIAPAVRHGIERALKAVFRRNVIAPDEVTVLLDGALRAPSLYLDQRTIIGGDGIEPAIGLASIMAKVTRDRHMVRLAAKYPQYQLAVHKGYGTKLHREMIQTHGLAAVHRRSFCTRLSK